MPSVRSHDLESTSAQLQEWMREKLGRVNARVSDLVIPAGAGSVNDTFIYEVAWLDGAQEREVREVCRAQPDGYSNLQDNDVLDQARVLVALGQAPDLPVPEVIAVEEDVRWLGRPFFIMEAVSGEAAPDYPPYTTSGWLFDADADQQRAVYRQAIEALNDVHAVDPAAIGLGDLDQRVGDESALAAQLRRFREFHVWGCDGTIYPVLEEAYRWLVQRFPASEGPAVINWNDGRLGNMLFEDLELRSLLDWELITIGPREVDLGWFLWHDRFMAECLGPAMSGQPPQRLAGSLDLVEGSAMYAEVSGHDPQDMDWYEMFAAYKLGVYLMRHGKGLIATGQEEADSGVDHVNVASLELGRMLGGFPVEMPA